MFRYFQVYDLNGIGQSHDWAVSKYKEIQQKFSEEHPDFFGAKTIYNVLRFSETFVTDRQARFLGALFCRVNEIITENARSGDDNLNNEPICFLAYNNNSKLTATPFDINLQMFPLCGGSINSIYVPCVVSGLYFI